MTVRPILFSGPMVRAILDGRKTQTRRVLKINGARPDFCGGRNDGDDPTCWGWEDPEHGNWGTLEKEPGQRMGWRDWRGAYAPGDRLWVREAWRCKDTCDDVPPRDMGNQMPIRWEADGALSQPDAWYWIAQEQRRVPVTYGRHRPSLHMPRWASRLTLTVTDVRVERLQEISQPDMIAEGLDIPPGPPSPPWATPGMREDYFKPLWDSLNAKRGYGWDANPWVAALTFEVHRGNIDQVTA